jgi:hypothetical protein
MQLIQKATVGIRRDLPIEISWKDIAIASKGWEDGRVALNQYLVALNSSLSRLLKSRSFYVL